MAKQPKVLYVCEQCGASDTRWTGRCTTCQAWNSMKEQSQAKPLWAAPTAGAASHGVRLVPSAGGGTARAQPIASVPHAEAGEGRLHCGIAALDRVLGGGLCVGSLVLLGGDPGIGKSTLLLQLLHGLCEGGGEDAKVLYVSGEESLQQTAQRARRLGAVAPGLHVLSEARLTTILEEAQRLRPQVLAIDSIQMVLVDGVDSLPGSLNQIREAATRLLSFAKEEGVATVLVGHMTKEGALAGPRTLEHLVDTVLLFEGERGHPYRILRASKNRFGPTSEIGVFEMRGAGLREVRDPSAMLLAERPVGVAGSVVTATLEGSLPLLLEVQALVAGAAGVPRRTALGIDPYRVALLLAVIERHAGIDMAGRDVFVNVAGGLKLEEPAADLAVAMALCSSATGRAVDPMAVCFGEVGLSGEVRAVVQPELRLTEAAKLGFHRCVLPAATARALLAQGGHGPLEVIGVRDVPGAIEAMLGPRGAR